MKRIVLASASPRRKELLEQAGIRFEIIPSTAEEKITKNNPAEVVVELSEQKAYSVAANQKEECFVIGADTVVSVEDQILGKPRDEKEAENMLNKIQGKIHKVYTGVSVYKVDGQPEKICSFYEVTRVKMYPMTKEQIKYYVSTKEPMDKAGAYGIQGKSAIYVQEICGDYNNVVGLPIARLYQEMYNKGIDLI